MKMPISRNGLVGLVAVGATAGLGLITLLIYREVRRRRSRQVALEAGRMPRLLDTAALLDDASQLDSQGG